MSKWLKYLITASILILMGISIYIKIHSGNKITVAVMGDILLDRGVGQKISETNAYYPYEEVEDIISEADISLANLECPLTSTGTPVLKKSNLIFKGSIDNISALKKAGFDILNLANNHTMDYGPEGLVSTINILAESGIKALGAGQNSEEAHKPVIMEVKGIKAGFLSFSAFPPEGYFCFEDRPDISYFDETLSGNEIKAAKKECDVLFVSFHWGKEFDFQASADQKKVARFAIDNGADMVIGGHPHVLQGVEKYKGRLIFYSLGNFVFDRQIPKGTDETAIISLTLNGKYISEAEIIPIHIADCQPRETYQANAIEILNKLKQYSQGMNSDIVIKNSRGIIKLQNQG